MGLRGVDLTPDDIRELVNICRRVKGMRVGPGLTIVNGTHGITIGLVAKREYKPEPLTARLPIGLHQGDIYQMTTDEAAAWGPAQFGP